MSETKKRFGTLLLFVFVAAISLGVGVMLSPRGLLEIDSAVKAPAVQEENSQKSLWMEETVEEQETVPHEQETVAEPRVVEAARDFQGLTPSTFVKLAKGLQDAVVNISTTKVVQRQRGFGLRPFPSPFGENDPFQDFFERFFGDLPPQVFKQRSLGSGFIINKEGYIVTNNHVIENADEIRVRLVDEREYAAKIIGRDPKTDVALIKIEAKNNLPVAPLGDSDRLEIGEWVMAIGNPFGLSHTVTIGIVSAKGRIIGAGPYDDFIQTDASINPGNSGGPLISLRGKVIGINTAIIASGQGIGFAIPINMVKTILPQLKEKGKVTRGWLGVTIQKVTPDLAESFGLKEETGALVSGVIPDSPAEGILKQGDVILKFDGKKIDEMHELPAIVAATPVGKKVKIEVFRENKVITVDVEIGELKEEAVLNAEAEEDLESKLGMTVQEITPDIAQQLHLEGTRGVIVSSVAPGSVADMAGIHRGDVLREVTVGGKEYPIEDLDDYRLAFSKAEGNELLRIRLERGEGSLFVVIRIPSDN